MPPPLEFRGTFARVGAGGTDGNSSCRLEGAPGGPSLVLPSQLRLEGMLSCECVGSAQ